MVCSSGSMRSIAIQACTAIVSLMVTVTCPAARSAEWEPPPPMPDKFDWVQLTSGEWVKGQIKVMYEGSLEFDSEEFELLHLDFADVKEIRSAQVLNVRMRGGQTATGKVLLEDKSVKVLGDKPQQFDRAELLSFTAGAQRAQLWTGNGIVGGNIRSGNADEVQASANVSSSAAPRTGLRRLPGNYIDTNDVEIRTTTARTQWDWFFSEKMFLRPVFFEYFCDPFQNISTRMTLGTGLGYQIIDTSKTDWSVFAGPAFQKTTFDDVQQGEDDTVDTWALSAGTTYETEITKNIDFIYDYRFQLTDPESGKYNHHMIGTLEVELTHALDFDLSLVWDRIEEPRANADGTVPEQDDFRVIFGIGYDF